MNEYQYSYLCIKLGYQLMREPLVPGTEIDAFDFGAKIAQYITTPGDTDFKKSFREYGPWHESTSRFKSQGQLHVEAVKAKFISESNPVLLWTGDFANAAKQSELLLSPFNRWGFAFQGWWQEQDRILPVWVKVVLFALALVLGAIIDRLFLNR